MPYKAYSLNNVEAVATNTVSDHINRFPVSTVDLNSSSSSTGDLHTLTSTSKVIYTILPVTTASSVKSISSTNPDLFTSTKNVLSLSNKTVTIDRTQKTTKSIPAVFTSSSFRSEDLNSATKNTSMQNPLLQSSSAYSTHKYLSEIKSNASAPPNYIVPNTLEIEKHPLSSTERVGFTSKPENSDYSSPNNTKTETHNNYADSSNLSKNLKIAPKLLDHLNTTTVNIVNLLAGEKQAELNSETRKALAVHHKDERNHWKNNELSKDFSDKNNRTLEPHENYANHSSKDNLQLSGLLKNASIKNLSDLQGIDPSVGPTTIPIQQSTSQSTVTEFLLMFRFRSPFTL